jgi:hypothetical protein
VNSDIYFYTASLNKYGILALVTNGKHNENYTGSKNIALAVETQEAQGVLDFSEFNKIDFVLDVRTGADDYSFFTGTANITSYNESTGLVKASNYETDFDGEVWLKTELEATINPDIPSIFSISVSVYGASYGETYNHSFSCDNIPYWITSHENKVYFLAEKSAVCDKLTSYSFSYYDINGNSTVSYGLGSVWCEEDSDIKIEFWKE